MAIDLKEAVSILECGDWFSVRYITADVAKGTGGKVIEIAKCRILRNYCIVHVKETTIAAPGIAKKPNHNLHFTRNLQLYNQQVRKVHPPLITHINNCSLV